VGGLLGTLIFIVYRLVAGAGVSGTVSAFALVFALLAILLLVVAMIGEYVGRIYSEAKARPYFVVQASHRVEGVVSEQHASQQSEKLA
jgi:Na+-transporting methylmalonyl-CoA/oxaloacetate decarboxylase gamma subunit